MVARRCTRDPHRAALLADFWLSLFYTYGHVYTALEGSPLGHHRWLGLIWLALGALGTGLILRRLRNPRPASQFAAVLGVILLLLALGQMALFGLQQAQTRRAAVDQPVMLKIAPTSPDIYYIILDSYSRADMLQTYYGYDNSAFIAQLEALGFYVPPCAQSNYALTALSLSSTLNMDYLETYAADLADQNANWSHLGEYIQHSAVRTALEARAYRQPLERRGGTVGRRRGSVGTSAPWQIQTPGANPAPLSSSTCARALAPKSGVTLALPPQ